MEQASKAPIRRRNEQVGVVVSAKMAKTVVVAVERLVREHFDGVRDRQKQLWALLNFELWCREAK